MNVAIKICDPFAGQAIHTFVGSLGPVMCNPIGSPDFYALFHYVPAFVLGLDSLGFDWHILGW